MAPLPPPAGDLRVLRGRRILLGVSGGIAAYKALEVLTRLRKAGAEVIAILTEAATRMVTPLSFESLSGRPVYVDMYQQPREWAVEHIALSEWAEALLVAPATADVLAKFAHGLADDYLTTTALALEGVPILLVPSMNHRMYRHPATRSNLERLRSYGFHLMQPRFGRLASGAVGKGRLPEPEEIVAALAAVLQGETLPDEAPEALRRDVDLAGLRLLVTAGPTVEPVDPVRFLSNPSTGRMGFAVAEAARDRGARVHLVTGPVALPDPGGVEVRRVQTALEMREACLELLPQVDAVVKTAAVADFRPADPLPSKLKKEGAPHELSLRLVRNPDILAELGERKRPGQILVGFAAETGDVERHAREKLARKRLDLVVANDVTESGAGFAGETNRVLVIDAAGRAERWPLATKREVADRLLDRVGELWRSAGCPRGEGGQPDAAGGERGPEDG